MQKEHQNIYRIDVPVVSEINAKIGKERIHYILFTLQIYKKYLKKRNFKASFFHLPTYDIGKANLAYTLVFPF